MCFIFLLIVLASPPLLHAETKTAVFAGAVARHYGPRERAAEFGEADKDGNGLISVGELYEYVHKKVREAFESRSKLTCVNFE
jgi:hypothetical protein